MQNSQDLQTKKVQTFHHGAPLLDKDLPYGYYYNIYPAGEKLLDRRWDFYGQPCDNAKMISNKDKNIKLYRCEGHTQSIENVYFHGKPHHNPKHFDGFYFHIYPPNKKVVDKRWDFYVIPCNNAVPLDMDDVRSYRCFGHRINKDLIGDVCDTEIVPSLAVRESLVEQSKGLRNNFIL